MKRVFANQSIIPGSGGHIAWYCSAESGNISFDPMVPCRRRWGELISSRRSSALSSKTSSGKCGKDCVPQFGRRGVRGIQEASKRGVTIGHVDLDQAIGVTNTTQHKDGVFVHKVTGQDVNGLRPMRRSVFYRLAALLRRKPSPGRVRSNISSG